MLFLISAILLFAHAVYAGEKILAEDFNRYESVHLKADADKNLWTAYYDMNSRIHVQNIAEGTDFIMNDGSKEGASRGLAFDVQGDRVFSVWRDEIAQQGRVVTFRAASDGGKKLSDPVVLDPGRTKAFTRLKMGANSKGEIIVLWYGDTRVKDTMYHFYATQSSDSGETFSEPQNLTTGYHDAIYPSLLVSGGNSYVFAAAKRDGDRYMIFRKTTDGGKTWTDPVEIMKTGEANTFIEPFRVGDRLHVVWLDEIEGYAVIRNAYSDDEGETWNTHTFGQTKGLYIFTMHMAHDSKGDIYIALGASHTLKEKNNVYLIRSEDNGASWEDMVTLRHYPFDNTHAETPTVYAAENGEVVVVWEDYRNIRSNLYMQYSLDHGRTWQEQDNPLEEPGRFNTAVYAYTDRMIKQDDTYYLLARRYKGDLTKQKADLLLIDFTLKKEGRE